MTQAADDIPGSRVDAAGCNWCRECELSERLGQGTEGERFQKKGERNSKRENLKNEKQKFLI